ncbi:MAG: hypothetical protein KJO38_05965 [Gammaproteobacteria bacterium]|nr:hypothetical protein [Gammaproteobacteria bacterium]
MRAPLMLAATAILLAGCNSKTIVDKHSIAPSYVSTGEKLVVLGRRNHSSHQAEEDFVDCIGQTLQRSAQLGVISDEEFIDGMYPWFEAQTAPTDVRQLDKLIQNRAVSERIKKFGVRYIVWVDGFTETVDSQGSVSCAVGPGGGGCFGFASWDDEARYEASVWDFTAAAESGRISTETKGTSYMPAIIIPIPMLARVQATACRNMAQQLAQFFVPGEATILVEDVGAVCPEGEIC